MQTAIRTSFTPVINRLRELDFLRGVAIMLVLLRHTNVSTFVKNMGWIGVDLFFVISGFLVSGLLFKEYLKFGDIQPKRFLIRRGFKIYPIYYFFYVLYLIPILLRGNFSIVGFLSDMSFTQNYVKGWGYAYAASWSLAVEEHFYFGLALFLWFGIKYNKITLQETGDAKTRIGSFEKMIILTLIAILIIRVVSNLVFPMQISRNFTMTHLRIDSLLAGVYISYMYYFKLDYLRSIFEKYKRLFFIIAFLGLAWTPFIDPIPSFFVMTSGFSVLYISFGIVLVYFLLEPAINQKLNGFFGSPVVNLVSKIGYCSYSIYIIHIFVDRSVHQLIGGYHLPYYNYIEFILTSVVSILLGLIMTHKIERYFLRIRDKYFPSRA